MTILVTGANGFAACHLLEALLTQPTAARLFALTRGGGWPAGFEPLADRVTLVHAELTDAPAVEHVLASVGPERIFHLAGFTDPARSLRQPELAWKANLTASRVLYETLVKLDLKPRIVHVSSGAVYGDPPDPAQLITESTEPRPNNPYAASKAAADLLAFQCGRSWGLPIMRARPFNHIGPGLAPRFALANWAAQVVAIERGQQPPELRVGNLDPERDHLDVRDVAAAYLLLMEHGEPGAAYNIALGRWFTMQVWLDELLKLTPVPIRVVVDPSLVRRVETATVRVDVSKIKSAVGWQPRSDVPAMLAGLLDYYRATGPAA
ncbi:MAG TPA: GDP-mannose 4,6-dehydratase [Gemmatales bacterium]|nr:GDP-mannose 4,6-dehydratase [Gemmatales bacterium]